MTLPVVPTTGPQVPQVNTSAPVAPDATTAGTLAQTHGGAEISSKTTFNSMEELKKNAPELYRKMMEGIAMNICGQMKQHQDRLARMMRESTRNNG